MPHLLPDLIADPLSFVVGTFTPTTPTLMSANVKTAFVAGGWDLITDDTGISSATAITVQSQQSPWWDHGATPPVTYIAKIRFKFWVESGTMRGQMLDPDGVAISTPSNLGMLTYTASQEYHYNVCPYQAVFKDLGGGPSMFISVLHTPKFEQEAGLVNLAVMARDMHAKLWQEFNNGWVYAVNASGTFSHAAYESVNRSGSLGFALLINPTGTLPIGLYNRSQDPTMADASKFLPFMGPAVLSFSNSTDISRTRGWLWNALLVGKGYTPDKILTIGGITLQGFTDNLFGGSGYHAGTVFFVTARN